MTNVRFGMEIYGIKEALRELNQVDKVARRDVTKRYKAIVEPAVQDAKRNVPPMPLSGFARGWKTKSGFRMLPWQNDEASKRIKAGIDTRRPRRQTVGATNLTVFFVRWQGAINTVFDLARKGVLGANLTQEHGAPSRVLWPAVLKHEREINHDMLVLMNDVMDQVNRKLQ